MKPIGYGDIIDCNLITSGLGYSYFIRFTTPEQYITIITYLELRTIQPCLVATNDLYTDLLVGGMSVFGDPATITNGKSLRQLDDYKFDQIHIEISPNSLVEFKLASGSNSNLANYTYSARGTLFGYYAVPDNRKGYTL